MGVCILCTYDNEECEYGVGTGVNDTMLSETLEVVGFGESDGRPFWFRKKPMNLCGSDSEEREQGVGAGVNTTMLSETLEVVGFVEAVRRTKWRCSLSFVHYESIKRDLNKRLIFECRCDPRLKGKTEGSTRLSYTRCREEP